MEDRTAHSPPSPVWLIDRRLAVAERPGGGGRSHRVPRRNADLSWWAAAGVTDIVSGMSTRHGLVDHALASFAIHWFPLPDERHDDGALDALVARVESLLAADRVVLVHIDRPGSRLAGLAAALRLGLGLAGDPDEALLQTARDGLPLGEPTESLLARYAERADGAKLA